MLYYLKVCYTKLDTDLNFNDQQKDLCTFLLLNINSYRETSDYKFSARVWG